jgi:hypothetical protein
VGAVSCNAPIVLLEPQPASHRVAKLSFVKSIDACQGLRPDVWPRTELVALLHGASYNICSTACALAAGEHKMSCELMNGRLRTTPRLPL